MENNKIMVMINGYPRLHEGEEEEDFIDVTYLHHNNCSLRRNKVGLSAADSTSIRQGATSYGQPPNSYKHSSTVIRQQLTGYAPSPSTFQHKSTSYRHSPAISRELPPNFQKSPTSTRQQPTTTRELPAISRQLPTITDEELLKLSTRDLNFALKGCSKESMVALRRRRRLLKNRTYAQRFRDKRVTAEHKYAEENTMLKKQIADNLKERDLFKKKYFALLEAFRNAETTLCSNVQV